MRRRFAAHRILYRLLLTIPAIFGPSVLLAGDPPLPPDDSLNWWTIDGGIVHEYIGGTSGNPHVGDPHNQVFSLFSSLGQPDLGQAGSVRNAGSGSGVTINGSVLGGFLFADRIPAPIPTATIDVSSCCPPAAVPLTATPSATPTPFPTGTPTAEYVRAKYDTVGKSSELMPSDFPAITSDAPQLIVADTDGTKYISPFVSHIIYHDGLWRNGQQPSDFAERIVRMIGSTVSSVYDNPNSGYGFSRSAWPGTSVNSAAPDFRIVYQKYNLGTSTLATALGGGKHNENIQVIAKLSRASSALPDSAPNAGFVHTIQGSDDRSLISSEPVVGTPTAEAYDPRTIKLEDREPVQAGVWNAMVGLSGFAALDTKTLPGYRHEYLGRQRLAGFIERAVGTASEIVAGRTGSYFHTSHAIGGSFELSLDEGVQLPAQSMVQPVENYIGVDLAPPYNNHRKYLPPADQEYRLPIIAANGLVVRSQAKGIVQLRPQDEEVVYSVYSGHGSAMRERGNLPPSISETPVPTPAFMPVEQNATLLCSDDVVVGDGKSDIQRNGFDTDGLINAHGVKLTGRSQHPSFDLTLPKCDRVGLLYMGESGDLRVSVAAPLSAPNSWKDAPVAWVSLKLESPAIPPISARATHPQEQYRYPRIQVIAFQPIGDTNDAVVVLKDVRAFQHDSTGPIYWRRVAFGRNKLGATDWQAVQLAYDQEQFTIAYDQPGLDGNGCYDGQVVELLVLDTVSGSPASTSFAIKKPTE